MGSPFKEDHGGLTLVVKDLEVGVTKPGAAGTSLSATQLGTLNVTVGTNVASKQVTADANGDIGLVSGSTIKLGSATGTFVSNAVTITKRAAQLTSESLTTAAAASQALTVTLTGVAATDLAFVTWAGGTSTTGTPLFKVVCTTNTVTVTVLNNHASAAFNGTFIFNLWVLKA